MAETKDKLVDLEDLKVLADDTTTKLGGKLAVPLNEGTQGQVLTANGDGTSQWTDAKGGLLDINEQKILTKNNTPVDEIIFAGDSPSHQNTSSVDIRVLENGNYSDARIVTIKSTSDDHTSAELFSSTSVCVDTFEDMSGLLLYKKIGGEFHKRVIAIKINDSSVLVNRSQLMVLDDNIAGHLIGYLEPSFDVLFPGLCKGDETTVSMQTGTGTLSVKDGGITMAKLAQDVKDAIAGNAPTVNETDVRRIVNEQLAKMKFTINDQGHLIIETPEA